jgi:CSLREA domain-containing protein
MRLRVGTLRTGSGLRRGLPAICAAGLLLALPSGAGAATIRVNTTTDEFASGPRCSLREAIWSSNNDSNSQAPGCRAGGGVDVIRVPAGSFRLNRPAPPPANVPENGNVFGDLDVTAPVSIVHIGLRPTVITNNIGTERVLHNLVGEAGLRLQGVTIEGGGTVAMGGAILNEGRLTIDSSAIAFSTAGSGGGIASIAGSVLVRNSTIYGNRASEDGGGIWVGGGSIALRSVTVSGNETGSGDGAGAFVFSSGGPSQLSLRSTLLAGNRDSGDEAHDCARIGGTISSRGNNLIGNTNGCGYQRGTGDLTNRSARIIEFDDFGGPTPTVNLRSSSPAINAARGCPRTDQRGVPRGRGPCTIGAWELARCRGVVINSVGTNGPELLIGTSRADGFLALGGADTVRGLGGNDGACGGGGPDRLEGGGANDRLDGGPNRDTCLPGGGRNRLFSCELRRRIW